SSCHPWQERPCSPLPMPCRMHSCFPAERLRFHTSSRSLHHPGPACRVPGKSSSQHGNSPSALANFPSGPCAWRWLLALQGTVCLVRPAPSASRLPFLLSRPVRFPKYLRLREVRHSAVPPSAQPELAGRCPDSSPHRGCRPGREPSIPSEVSGEFCWYPPYRLLAHLPSLISDAASCNRR